MLPADRSGWQHLYGDRANSTLRYSAAVLPAVVIMWWALDYPARSLNYVFATIGGVAAWYLSKRFPNSKVGAGCFILCLICAIVGEVFVAGMASSPTIWVLPFFPMLAGHLLGLRYVLPVCVLVCFLILGAHSAEWFGLKAPVSLLVPGEEVLTLFGLTIGYCRVAYFSRKTLEESSTTLKEEAIALIKSRFKADRASVAKSAFLANMSQQVKIPLQGASRDAQGLVDSIPGSDLEHALALRECTDRIEWIVSDIVDISRIESGVLSTQPVVLDFDMVRDSITLECSEVAQGANVEIEFHQQGVAPSLLGDPRLLSRLVTILVLDAIFRARSKVSIDFRFSAVSDNIVVLQLHIRHDGLVEDVEGSEVVFGMRVQDDERGGTARIGLGLSMAESLAEYMGGSLDVALDESLHEYQRVAQVALPIAHPKAKVA